MTAMTPSSAEFCKAMKRIMTKRNLFYG